MRAVFPKVSVSDSLFKKPGWLGHATEVGLTFAVKTYVALLLALYIAFRLGLDDPRWSFLTVFVVAQPDSGPRSGQKFLPHSRYHRRAVRCDCARVYPSPIRRALFNRRRNLDLLLQLCRPGGA